MRSGSGFGRAGIDLQNRSYQDFGAGVCAENCWTGGGAKHRRENGVSTFWRIRFGGGGVQDDAPRGARDVWTFLGPGADRRANLRRMWRAGGANADAVAIHFKTLSCAV